METQVPDMQQVPFMQNPADLSDPENQRKISENVLNQLGLHPDQQGARNLLDLHFQGPTAAPAVKDAIAPLVAPPAAPPPVATPSGGSQSEDTADALSSKTTLPGPGAFTPPSIIKNTHDQTEQAQNEKARLINTGSGISQIHNPFLRVLAHVGEIGGAALGGAGLESIIPGTTFNHDRLINTQEHRISQGLHNSQEEANTDNKVADTQSTLDPTEKTPTELSLWVKQNPNRPINDFWAAKAAQNNGKLTPEEMAMKNLMDPVEKGGKGLSAADALIQMKKSEQEIKPKTSSSTQNEVEAIIAKTMPNGIMDPKIMSNIEALVSQIANSDQITDEEKGKVFAHIASKATPASQGSIADKRLQGMLLGHLAPAVDTATGTNTFVNPAQVNAHPGQYAPAGPEASSMSRESKIADINYNISQVRDAYKNLKNGLDTATRAQIAYMLDAPDRQTAFNSFMHSSVGKTLTPDQADLVTSLANLNENAAALGSLGGFGQGSNQLRNIIHGTVAGSGTPDVDYANRQLDLMQGTLDRLAGGIPKSGVKQPQHAPTPKTGEHNQPTSKTFTKAQVEAVAKANGMTYEAAKADAIAHGHKVKE